MPEFTKTQGRYLSFISAFISSFDYAPSMEEIGQAMGVASSSVNGMLKKLGEKRLIEREPGVARSIKLLVDGDVLPKWDQPISRTAPPRAPRRSTASFERMMKMVLANAISPLADTGGIAGQAESYVAPQNPLKTDTVFRFKVTLKDFTPVIWRRFETTDATMEELHLMIQIAMGWENAHMHEFAIGKSGLTHPMFLEGRFERFGPKSYENMTINDLVNLRGPKLRMTYTYDFGDGWTHDIRLEKVMDLDSKATYPRCTAGKNACPPEDVGGVWGYARFLEALADPEHESHEHFIQWHGPCDPEAFDLDEVNEELQAMSSSADC